PLPVGERGAGRGGGRLGALQPVPERLALEVVPEARQLRELALELRDERAGFLAHTVRRGHLLLGRLAARELLTVVMREMRLGLALIRRARKVGDQLRNEPAPALPQAAQLVEGERRVGGLVGAEARLELGEHVLHALRGRLLLLDQVLEPVGLLLQLAVSLLE